MQKSLRNIIFILLVATPIKVKPSNGLLGPALVACGLTSIYLSAKHLLKSTVDKEKIDSAKIRLQTDINNGMLDAANLTQITNNFSWMSASPKEKKYLRICAAEIMQPQNRETALAFLGGSWGKNTHIELSREHPKRMSSAGRAQHFASMMYMIEQGINGFDPHYTARRDRKKKAWKCLSAGILATFAGLRFCSAR
jgi:hypothetical protein